MSGHLISTDLVPVGGFYLIVMGVLAVGLRLHRRGSVSGGSVSGGSVRGGSVRGGPAASGLADPDPARGDPAPEDRARGRGRRPGWLARQFPPGWRAFAAQVTATTLGGYLLLMAVLTGYYYGVSRVKGNFVVSACTGCAMLGGLALPVFAAASWLTWRRADRPARTAAPPPALPPSAGPEAVPD